MVAHTYWLWIMDGMKGMWCRLEGEVSSDTTLMKTLYPRYGSKRSGQGRMVLRRSTIDKKLYESDTGLRTPR